MTCVAGGYGVTHVIDCVPALLLLRLVSVGVGAMIDAALVRALLRSALTALLPVLILGGLLRLLTLLRLIGVLIIALGHGLPSW